MQAMAADKPPRYYRERGNVAFWDAGRAVGGTGIKSLIMLGPKGANAKAEAIRLNGRLDEARKALKEGKERPARYKPGTLGAFYERVIQRSEFWTQAEGRTREDYERAWPHIEKRFGDTIVTHITASDSEAFHVDIHPAHEPNPKRDPKGKRKLKWNEAHRVLKIWRALATALVTYEFRATAPIGKVSNPEPKGRAAVWLHHEVVTMAEGAQAAGELGMAVALRLAWDAMLSPVDVWALPLAGWIYSPGASEVNTSRRKTDKSVLVAVSDETAELVESYLATLRAAGVDMDPDLPLIRRRTRVGDRRSKTKATFIWRPFNDKDDFGKCYRAVREAAFPGDERQFLDLRRSALTEAQMGGASKEDLGAAAANNLAQDERLAATYLRSASKRVLEARAKGRAPMAAKFGS